MKTIYYSFLTALLLGAPIYSNAQCSGVFITMNVLSQTNVSCNGGSNGEVIVEGVGGTGPYTFDWAPIGVTNDTVSNLSAGMYVITITDFNGCDSTDTVWVTEPSILDLTATATPATCGFADGSATAFPSGGAGSYTYQWFPFGGTNQTATGLVSGDYQVTVTDANLCTDIYVVTVPAVGGPTVTLTGQTNVSCFGGSDGTANVNASGGVSPYTYNWLPGNLTGSAVTGLSSGTYTVTVTDNAGCSDDLDVIISQPTALNASEGTVNPATCGFADGSAQVSVTGGTSPYTYSWSTGGIGSTENNLSAGVYYITVTDDKGCQDSTQIGVPNIGGPTVTINTIVDISCYGMSDGAIQVDATGGSGNYTYQWVPTGGNSAVATNLSAGIYTVLVTDDSGCVGLLTQEMTQPNQIFINSTVVMEDCGEMNGAVFTTASGGTIGPGGFNYLWSPGGQTSVFISNLVHGDYTLTVTDLPTGCTMSQTFTVEIEGNIPVTASPTTAAVYAGEPVEYTSTYGPPATDPVTYLWTPDYSLSCTDCATTTAYPMVDTFFVITITDVNDCWGTDTVWVTILEPCKGLMVPTIFSPNGDGLNDELCVLGSCLDQMEFTIFNRWGQVVYRSLDRAVCWDGNHNGNPVMSGIYAYRFHGVLLDGTTVDEEGKITVVR